MSVLAATVTAILFSLGGLVAASVAAAWILVQGERRVLLWVFIASAVVFAAQTFEQVWVVAFRLSAMGVISDQVVRDAVRGSTLVLTRKLSLAVAPALYTTAVVAALRGGTFPTTTRWMAMATGFVAGVYLVLLLLLDQFVRIG